MRDVGQSAGKTSRPGLGIWRAMDQNLVEERRRDLWLSIPSISITLTLHPHLNSCPVDWKYSRYAQDLDPLVHVSSHLAKTELIPGLFHLHPAHSHPARSLSEVWRIQSIYSKPVCGGIDLHSLTLLTLVLNRSNLPSPKSHIVALSNSWGGK